MPLPFIIAGVVGAVIGAAAIAYICYKTWYVEIVRLRDLNAKLERIRQQEEMGKIINKDISEKKYNTYTVKFDDGKTGVEFDIETENGKDFLYSEFDR